MTRKTIIPIAIVLIAGAVCCATARAEESSKDAALGQKQYELRLRVKPGDVLKYTVSEKQMPGPRLKAKGIAAIPELTGTIERTVVESIDTEPRQFVIVSKVSEQLVEKNEDAASNAKPTSDATPHSSAPRYESVSVIKTDERAGTAGGRLGYGMLPTFSRGVEPGGNGLIWCRFPDKPVAVGEVWSFKIRGAVEDSQATSKLIGTESVNGRDCLHVKTSSESRDPIKGGIEEDIWIDQSRGLPVRVLSTWAIEDLLTCSLSFNLSTITQLDPVETATKQRQSLLVRYMLEEVDATAVTSPTARIKAIETARKTAELFVGVYGDDDWSRVLGSFNKEILGHLESRLAATKAN